MYTINNMYKDPISRGVDKYRYYIRNMSNFQFFALLSTARRLVASGSQRLGRNLENWRISCSGRADWPWDQSGLWSRVYSGQTFHSSNTRNSSKKCRGQSGAPGWSGNRRICPESRLQLQKCIFHCSEPAEADPLPELQRRPF